MELSREYINAGLSKQFQWGKGADPIVGLRAMREAMGKNVGPEMLAKGFVSPTSAVSGLAQYDLEQGARLLYPITTWFRNMIPRMTGGTGIQANWRSVTAVNPSRIALGLSEGHRGGAMAQTTTDNFAKFYTNGMDNFVTEQAYLAGLTFEDLMALATTTLLQGVMEGEELADIGGNNSVALGTTGTVTAAASNTGGFLADATYSVICVALTYDGMIRSTVAGGVMLPYTRANMDGSTDAIQGFCGIQSAATGSLTVSGGTGLGSVTASVTGIRGAFGYAWFLGTSGAEKIAAITGAPAVTLKYTAAAAGGTQAATAIPATDTSLNALQYNGILTQIVTAGSGGYYVDLAGQPLTTAGSGSGGLTEINTALQSFFTNNRLIPTDIIMSAVDQRAAAALILTGNTNLAPFFMGASAEEGLAGATTFKRYVNPIGFGNPTLEVHAHPFVPPGTIIFYSRTNPYPLSNVPNLIRKLCRRDYWSVDWPVVTLQRTMGVYFDAVLQLYFAPAFGVISGVRSAGQ